MCYRKAVVTAMYTKPRSSPHHTRSSRRTQLSLTCRGIMNAHLVTQLTPSAQPISPNVQAIATSVTRNYSGTASEQKIELLEHALDLRTRTCICRICAHAYTHCSPTTSPHTYKELAQSTCSALQSCEATRANVWRCMCNNRPKASSRNSV